MWSGGARGRGVLVWSGGARERVVGGMQAGVWYICVHARQMVSLLHFTLSVAAQVLDLINLLLVVCSLPLELAARCLPLMLPQS